MKCILSIDDEPSMLRCLERSLESAGYRLHVTDNPDEGLRLLAEQPVDLILLDVRMPIKDGFKLYREMRTIKKLPVLFVTAYPRAFTPRCEEVSRMWEEQFADGMTDIIYKPFNLETLLEKVENLIGKADE